MFQIHTNVNIKNIYIYMFLSFFGHNFPSLLLFNLHHSSIPNDAYDMYIYIYVHKIHLPHCPPKCVPPSTHSEGICFQRAQMKPCTHWKFTWNMGITQLKWKIIFQTSTFDIFQGVTAFYLKNSKLERPTHQPVAFSRITTAELENAGK